MREAFPRAVTQKCGGEETSQKAKRKSQKAKVNGHATYVS
jgi:hypothetical protein